MPKFLVTSGSYFNPHTYEELSKPIVQAVEAHNAVQDAYDTISTETAALQRYITDNPGDMKAKMIYDDYVGKLSALQNNLWNNGYNASTRRDLSIARAGYVSDITRLAAAVKARQERGAAWSKMKMEHPELIMSDNPAIAGLDAYLDDDNFGQDIFSYSGKTFMEEVGSDIQARGNQILRKPEVVRDPDLAGRIITKLQNGFTSLEIDNAKSFVRSVLAGKGNMPTEDVISGALSLIDSDDPRVGLSAEEKLLAGALLSRLNATGAAGKVSDSEFNRLVGYGELGMVAGGIQKPTVQVQEDLEWKRRAALEDKKSELDLELDQYREKKKIDAEYAAQKASQDAAGRRTAANTGEIIRMESPQYREWANETKGTAKWYKDGQTKTIQSPDGNSSRTAQNEYQMATYLYETRGRAQVRHGFGGYDVAFDPKGDEKRVIRLRDGSVQNITISKMSASDAARLDLDPKTAVAVKDSNGRLRDDVSRQVSLAREDYFNHVNQLKAANPDIEKYAVDPKTQKRLRERYGYPETAPWDDFYSYMLTVARFGDESAVAIANDSSHDYAKKNLARAIIREYNSNSTEDHGKTSRFAFYEVNDGNTGHKKEGITDIRQIFGVKSTGELRDDTLTNISATLQDLASERPMVRIQTSVNPGKTFIIDADMLGSLFKNNYTVPISGTGELLGLNMDLSNSEMIDYLMLPIIHPEAVYEMSRERAESWSRGCYEALDGDFPVVTRQDGSVTPATPREIVRDKEFQEWLKGSIMEHVANPSAMRIRQVIGQDHEQYRGDQSSNTEPVL